MKTFLGRDDAHGARDRVPIGEIGPETNMFSLVDTGGIVYELKFLISSSFSEFKVLFSPRTCFFFSNHAGELRVISLR